jgi:hypothetical protein
VYRRRFRLDGPIQAYLETRPPVSSNLVFVNEREPLGDREIRALCVPGRILVRRPVHFLNSFERGSDLGHQQSVEVGQRTSDLRYRRIGIADLQSAKAV